MNVSPETILAHSGFVDALARGLLRDVHAAEDVAQEVRVAALGRPPRSVRSLRAWLAQVTRNFARQARRSEGRRAARERVAARDESIAGPEEILEREAARAAVVRALLELAEPSRTTLVLHYYEGLSAREIAVRLELPLETVRTRIRRGLARMRAQLAESDELRERGWMRALLPLASLGREGAAAAELAPVALAGLAPKLAIAAALGVAIVAWRFRESAVPPTTAVTPVAADEAEESERVAVRVLEADEERGARLAPDAAERASSGRERPRDLSAASGERVELLARFVRPDSGRTAYPIHGLLELRGRRGGLREVAVDGASEVLVPDLEPDLWTARVVARGVARREQVLDLSDPRRGEIAPRALGAAQVARFEERVFVWPDGWVALVVRTPEGEPLETIAKGLGFEPKNLFYAAFEARTQLAPPEPGAVVPPDAPQPARFCRPPTYPAWELPGGAVGSLELVDRPPLWVQLFVHGVALGWEHLRPGADELVFELDAATLARRLARVELRVVDAPGGAPVAGTRVTLKADTSPHRREDLMDVEPDDEGRVELSSLPPGRYELSIEGGEALHQDLLELAPGEERDLGEIVLAPGLAVPLRVVDARGRPVTAWIEIAPYRPGEAERDLYPPNLHRHTDRDGRFRLPMPADRSILRATLMDPRRGHPTDDRSPSVLLDPERPPLEELELVVRDPFEVRFDTPSRPGARIEVLDALGLVVARVPADAKDPRCELVPGSYLARVTDAAGDALGEVAFDVIDRARSVSLP